MRRLRFCALLAIALGAGTVQSVRATQFFLDGNTGDSNNHLFTYNGSTQLNRSEPPGNTMGNPGQIAIGPDGNVYLTDQDPFNGPGIDMFDGTTGQFVNQYLGSSFANGLFSPTGLAWGPDGKLYIADFGSNGDSYVSSYDGTTVTQVISPAAGLQAPEGIAFGTGGMLYIANSNSGVISRWDGTNVIAAFTPIVDSGGAFIDVAIRGDGNLYVTDSTNGVVQVFRESDGTYLGHYGNTGNVLVQPAGLAFAPNGDLYVVDAEGLQVFNSAGNFVNQLIQADSNPGDLNSGAFLAFSSTVPEPSAFLLSLLGLAVLAPSLGYKRGLNLKRAPARRPLQ